MNALALINWQAFKRKLQEHPEMTLQFQYGTGKWVDASYHITEIKQAPITSVDCGGKMNSWTEIIVQLWEPSSRENDHAMQVSKALSIIHIVEKSFTLNPLAIVKIEFGNSQFDTRQLYPGAFIIKDNNLIIDLNPDVTQCKAIGRGESCGTETAEDACCETDAEKTESKIQLVNLMKTDQSCTPESGCC